MNLLEWLGDLLDFINVVEHWRFFVVMLVAVGAACLAYNFMPAGGLRTFLVAGSIIIGIITGIVWERSS
jgi:hypothetical protein